MTPYYEQDGITIFCGDAREILPSLSKVDCVITDPVWPNAVSILAGSEDPAGLFAAAAAHFPSLCNRLVVQLGCDSDLRFLSGIPASLPFMRSCQLEYMLARPKGRILYTGDVAYAFGTPPPSRPGRMLIPGRMVSTKSSTRRPRTRLSKNKSFEGRWIEHPCPRRAEHVEWLVKWFANGTICDPFCGSGTTLAAAKKLGYSAIGIEINEAFCEVTARKLDQGVMFEVSGKSVEAA